MTKRRIFISIKIPGRLQDKIAGWQNDHYDLPVRWGNAKNLHLTVVPPWYADDDELVAAIAVAKEAVAGIDPFQIMLKNISYGPAGKNPRLIWLEGEESDAYAALKRNLEKELIADPETGYAVEDRKHTKIHLTIARIKPHQPDLVPIDQEVWWAFDAGSVDITESEATDQGVEQVILESIPLGGDWKK